MFIATLFGIFRFNELPEECIPFVQYKASLEKKDINEDEKIAILNIKGTESYHVLFLDSYQNLEEVNQELKEVHAKMNHSTKKILEVHL